MTVNRFGRLEIPVLAGVLLAISASPVAAQAAADLFDATVLHEVRLFINSRDLQRLRENYEANTYYTADLLWRNTRIRNVAVRSRGFGSRNPTKLGLRVDFNRYTRDQRFLGVSSLILDNLWQDPSFIREKLAMSLFERLNQPASRESFARLFLNNEYQGLYAIVEAVDDTYLSRTLGENTGYSFEYRWISTYRWEDLGDDLSAYRARFEPQNHELEADSTLFSPIRSLIAEVNGPDDAVWRERVEEYLDLTQFLTYVAVETFISELDGVLGYDGTNNFYLYRFVGTSRHRLLPWDKDNAFNDIESSIFNRVDEYQMVQRALAFPDLRSHYLDVVEQAATRAANDGWLLAEVERLAAMIADAVRADPRKQFSNDAFDDAIAYLREFARRRPAFVLDQVAAARR